MVHDLDFMDYTIPTVDYSYEVAHKNDDSKNIVEKYMERFETDYKEELEGTTKNNIGGITVYEKGGMLWAVYDYENLQGWV